MLLIDRDCARWGLHPAEVQKRRALFWELFITDCWQACVQPYNGTPHLIDWNQGLATGRCATFSLPFVDCELPADLDQTIADDGTIHPSCKYLFVHIDLRHSIFSSPILEGQIRCRVRGRCRSRDFDFACTEILHYP